MSIFRTNQLAASASTPPWQAQLDAIAVVDGMRAQITLVAPDGAKTPLDRSLSRIHYDPARDEIELRLGSLSGSGSGARLYLPKPTQVEIDRTPGLTTITVRDRGGSVTVVRLFAAEQGPEQDREDSPSGTGA